MTRTTTRATVEDRAPDRDLIERVDRVLARGGLVALPTETVYGVGARVDRGPGVERLAALKGRPHGRGLTWHVGTPAALERFERLSPMVRRLVARYWPGPLTLVLPGVPGGLEAVAEEGWTGVRMPAQQATAGILAELPYPVCLSSANRHGEPPHTSADAVERALGEGLELVVDGGPSRLGESSCVLRVGPGRFEVLRPGLYEIEQLRAVAGMKLGFACTGNTCRSPMAEGLAKKLIADRLATTPARIGEFGFDVRSMGVFASVGSPAARLAVQVMGEEGVDLGAHRSRAALAEDIESFDRIYCMTRSHQDALVQALPPGRAGNIVLLDPEGVDVPDPIGGGRTQYREAADRIRAALAARVDEWV